jgi:hypothetical protein
MHSRRIFAVVTATAAAAAAGDDVPAFVPNACRQPFKIDPVSNAWGELSIELPQGAILPTSP